MQQMTLVAMTCIFFELAKLQVMQQATCQSPLRGWSRGLLNNFVGSVVPTNVHVV